MPNVVAESENTVLWSGDTFRLIPSRFPPVSVYEGLVANDDFSALVEVENVTNPRLRSEARIASRAGEDAATPARLQNWNLAPFAYGDPGGSTFFDEERPCLEVATDRQTALAISVAKRRRFLESTSEAPIGLDMRMLKTPVAGRFADLRRLKAEEIVRRGRELGRSLADGIDGVLFRPVERPSAVSIAILSGGALQKTLQTSHYRYQWNGEKISLLYAFDAEGSKIDPDALREEADCLAA